MSETTTQEATGSSTEQPEDKQAKFKEFLGKLMGDIGRLHSQVDYLGRHTTTQMNTLGQRIDHIDKCMAILFEALHIEMPKPVPALLDASVELVETLGEGEVCELRTSFSVTEHPVYGNYQVVIGVGDEIQASTINNLHPIVAERMKQAFGELEREGTLVDGKFYYVRLKLFHAQPIDETSVRFNSEEPAANDEVASAPETTDVQPE